MSAARFARLDLNRDGHFTGELTTVFQSGLEVRLEQVYARLDADADGRFSVAELTPPRAQPATKVASTKPREVARREDPSVQ